MAVQIRPSPLKNGLQEKCQLATTQVKHRPIWPKFVRLVHYGPTEPGLWFTAENDWRDGRPQVAMYHWFPLF